MNGTQGPATDDGAPGSWASEALPMELRRELLQRELKKLGVGRREDAGRASANDSSMDEQETGHPQAEGGAEHAG